MSEFTNKAQAAEDAAQQARARMAETLDDVAEDPRRLTMAAGGAGFVLGLLVAGLVRRRVECGCCCEDD